MSVQLKLRRGTTAQHSTFTGAEGEVTVDTTKETIVVHDGVTPAGYPLARQDLSNVSPVATAKISDSAITTAKVADGAITSAKIADGTIVTGDIADGAITSAKIADGTIATADIANSAVTLAKISATGTPSSANYLRGDGTWAAPASGGITSITAGAGLTGGTITTTGTIAVDTTNGNIGTYAFLGRMSGTGTLNIGSTIAGSSLRPAAAGFLGSPTWPAGVIGPVSMDVQGQSTTMTGTWRCMGFMQTGDFGCANHAAATLFVRIS